MRTSSGLVGGSGGYLGVVGGMGLRTSSWLVGGSWVQFLGVFFGGGYLGMVRGTGLRTSSGLVSSSSGLLERS